MMLLTPILAVLSIVLPQGQMPEGPSPTEVAAMKKLGFLEGKWEGTGWMQQGRERLECIGTETIQFKLHGKAVLIEGRFTDKVSKKVVHETMGVVTFDEKSSKYDLHTYLFNRPNGSFELKVVENGFMWQMKPGNDIVIDYTMRLENGEWLEIGEVAVPGRPKMKFLELKLKKVP
jgi:hypothetical protein